MAGPHETAGTCPSYRHSAPGRCHRLQYTELVRHPGNVALHTALELSVLAAVRGHPLHVHTEGLRGTGKTTIVRAAARLLPTIVRIAGCPYNCDPARPHCPLHRDLEPADVLRLGTEAITAPFLEISPSAKIGTVVGCIDLARLTDPARPQAALLPGTLARAHRGVVFIDEVNRLADTSPELADALLDVMGTKPGRLQIEETGLSPVVLPCRVTVWAASNPDEEPGPLADIRRQLADRFDMAIPMRRPADPPAVLAVLARDELGDAEPEPAVADGTGRLRQELQARGSGALPILPPDMQELMARAYCDYQVESLRAVQAWQTAARLAALRSGRGRVEQADCLRTAPLVLRHRLEPEELARLLERLEAEGPAAMALAAAMPVEDGRAAAAPESSQVAQAGPHTAVETSPGGQRARGPWWRRWVHNSATASAAPGAPTAAGGTGATAPVATGRLVDPTTLPPITPRQAARYLSDLPPPEWWTPSSGSADGERS